MFLHVVMMNFKSSIPEDFFEKVQDFVDQVKVKCPGIVFYDFGGNFADRAQGYTHATSCGFVDSNSHDLYQISDIHQAMKNYMLPYINQIVVFDGHVELLERK